MKKKRGFFLSYLLKGAVKMIMILSIMAGAFIGVVLMGLLLCAKGFNNDACESCPYKWFYIDSITEENNNGTRY